CVAAHPRRVSALAGARAMIATLLDALSPGLSFARPWALVSLLAVPLALWLLRRRRGRMPALILPSAAPALLIRPSIWARLFWLPGIAVALALLFTSLGLAGPRLRTSRRADLGVEGIDIVVAFVLTTTHHAA